MIAEEYCNDYDYSCKIWLLLQIVIIIIIIDDDDEHE